MFSGTTMGTTYTVRVAADSIDAARVGVLERAVGDAVSEVDDRMTTYRESEITRFNARRSAEPFEVSPDTSEVVALALDLAARTEGALDVTIAPLVAAFGFGPSMPAGLPSQDRLDELQPRIGYSLLSVDAEGRLLKGHPELEVDLSAVAKGYAVDRAAMALDGQGATDYMVEIGGEVRARGRNERGRIWRIGVERPDSARGTVQRVVPLPDMAMATSGDYRQYREIEGTRISHIIDPRTARPIDHAVASATVLHPSCAFADGLATAMMVLGEDGMHLADENGWAVLLLVRTPDGFRERASSAFAALIESSEGPDA